jgi:peptide/nickel transport system permease protein
VSAFVARRVAAGLVTLFLVTVIVFILVNAAPGGPAAIVSMTSTAGQRAALTRLYGLNRPLFVRYVAWLWTALHGSLGTSYDYQQPVLTVIGQSLPNTAILAGAALAVSVVVGIPLGLWAALSRGRLLDHLISDLSVLGLSVPDFWLGIVLIIVFSVTLRWLPASGMSATQGGGGGGLLPHLVMPATVLSLVFMPNVVRLSRSSTLEVLGQDYVRTAHAKGASARRVTYAHALRNALIPVTSMVGLLFAALISGSAIVESVFAWPGVGRLAVQATSDRDYPVIMGVTVVLGAIVIAANILIDLLYGVLDPRIRYD